MPSQQISTLPIAVRVFPEHAGTERDYRSARFWRQPEGILIINTGTWGRRRGLIGSYRFLVSGECVEEGLFHHQLSKANVKALKKYVESHRVDADGHSKRVELLTRHEFLNLFYDLAYKARCLVVGYNLPAQLFRLAFSAAPARGFFAGGFSLGLWSYIDKKGRERLNNFRPRVCVKYVDKKRSLIGFTARNSPDQEDLIPEGSLSGEPRPGYRFPGHFLDARTLAFALADELYSLETATEAFGLKHGKPRIQP